MGKILLLDDHSERRRRLSRYLSTAGYPICCISDPEHFNVCDFSRFDLAIVNFFPDTPRTWDCYRKIKKDFPNLPVLVYLDNSFHAFRSLKQAIALVRGEGFEGCKCFQSKQRSKRLGIVGR